MKDSKTSLRHTKKGFGTLKSSLKVLYLGCVKDIEAWQ